MGPVEVGVGVGLSPLGEPAPLFISFLSLQNFVCMRVLENGLLYFHVGYFAEGMLGH